MRSILLYEESKAHIYSGWFCRQTQQDVLNVMGALYAAVLFLGVNNASSVQPVVAVERTVFYRERAAGMYSSIPYAIAQVSDFIDDSLSCKGLSLIKTI